MYLLPLLAWLPAMTPKVLCAFTLISGNVGIVPQNMGLNSLPKVSATYYSKPCFRTVQAMLLPSLWMRLLRQRTLDSLWQFSVVTNVTMTVEE